MRKVLALRPSPAVVISMLALLVALSGRASALSGRNKVDHNDLQKHSVHAGKIHAGAIKTGKLADAAVTGAKIANGSIGGSDLSTNSVGAANLESSAVRASKIAALVRVVDSAQVANNTGKFITTECPEGAKAITGGAEATNSQGVSLTESKPDGYEGAGLIQLNPTAWTAHVINHSGFEIGFTVEVVCMLE